MQLRIVFNHEKCLQAMKDGYITLLFMKFNYGSAKIRPSDP